MTLAFWIEAINSGGAKEYKQRHLAFFAKIIQSQGCFSLSADTPSTPNLEVIHPLALPIL